MEALIAACQTDDFPATIACVISNNSDAAGLRKAAAAGIATDVVDHRAYGGREDFDRALTDTLEAHGVEVVCLAGFMRILSTEFVEHWRDRLLNIHPSLLPAFKGLHVHERVLAAGVRFTGCTVHFVRPEMDTGPIIVQAAVPVAADDTPESLAARVLDSEHRCYPLALRYLAEGRLMIEGDIVRIVGLAAAGQSTLPSTINPPGD